VVGERFVATTCALEWKATSTGSKPEDGLDTFVFRDGLIRVQTVRYTLERT
jgi:hypothetical protein